MENAALNNVIRQFARMGAEVEVNTVEDRRGFGRPAAFRANVVGTGKQERFSFTINNENLAGIQVIDIDPKGRHILLNVTPTSDRPGVSAEPTKLLLGHDEMHWFVAPVVRSAINIDAAKQSLKPTVVQEAQKRAKTKRKHLHKRHQEAFIRQGEWFFVPRPDLVVDEKLTLKKEPIRRGAGKPHTCEEIYRTGGTSVWVCPRYPNGVTYAQYVKIFDENAEAKSWHWRQMQRGATVYARGRVTHRDHHTVVLQGWHEVIPNTEKSNTFVAFLD
ncbi:MAG: hypothetical protein WC505_07700 [Patescibacteria group bacterium]